MLLTEAQCASMWTMLKDLRSGDVLPPSPVTAAPRPELEHLTTLFLHSNAFVAGAQAADPVERLVSVLRGVVGGVARFSCETKVPLVSDAASQASAAPPLC